VDGLTDSRETDGQDGRAAQRQSVDPPHIRQRDSGREREGKQMSGSRPRDQDGVTSPRRFSIRAGPIPGMASRSSTDVKGPCSVR
jgi:hypothetical protein